MSMMGASAYRRIFDQKSDWTLKDIYDNPEADINVKVHNHGRPVGIAPQANVTQVYSHQYRTDSFHFRLAEVKENEGYYLDYNTGLAEFFLKPEKHETAEEEFPGDHID
jgi:hypothetical protein